MSPLSLRTAPACKSSYVSSWGHFKRRFYSQVDILLEPCNRTRALVFVQNSSRPIISRFEVRARLIRLHSSARLQHVPVLLVTSAAHSTDNG